MHRNQQVQFQLMCRPGMQTLWRLPGTKTFSFEKLLASAKSDTLRHEKLSVQMTSNPAWYAVMALPYLMEFPHECSEQVFHRFYANSIARHIAMYVLKSSSADTYESVGQAFGVASHSSVAYA